jgi:hypothetical protein
MNLQELDTLIRAILVDIKPYRDGDDDCEECCVELTELLYRIENVLSSKPVECISRKDATSRVSGGRGVLWVLAHRRGILLRLERVTKCLTL